MAISTCWFYSSCCCWRHKSRSGTFLLVIGNFGPLCFAGWACHSLQEGVMTSSPPQEVLDRSVLGDKELHDATMPSWEPRNCIFHCAAAICLHLLLLFHSWDRQAAAEPLGMPWTQIPSCHRHWWRCLCPISGVSAQGSLQSSRGWRSFKALLRRRGQT